MATLDAFVPLNVRKRNLLSRVLGLRAHFLALLIPQRHVEAIEASSTLNH